MSKNHPSQQVVTLSKSLCLIQKTLQKNQETSVDINVAIFGAIGSGHGLRGVVATGAPLSKRNAGVSVLGCAIAMVAVGGCAQVPFEKKTAKVHGHRGQQKNTALEWRKQKCGLVVCFKTKGCSYSKKNIYIYIYLFIHIYTRTYIYIF